MKKMNKLIIVVACALLTVSCHITINTRGNHDTSYRIKSSVQKIEREIPVSDYTGVDITAGVDVVLTDGEKGTIRVECDPDFQHRLDIKIVDSMLTIGVKAGVERVNINHLVKVYVPVSGIDTLMASHGANIISGAKLIVPQLYIKLVSSSDMTLEVECETIVAQISGTSDLTLQGIVGVFDLTASVNADANCDKLIADRVIFTVSGNSDASFFVNEEITGKACGSSSVYFRGEAKISAISVSGGADVLKRIL